MTLVLRIHAEMYLLVYVLQGIYNKLSTADVKLNSLSFSDLFLDPFLNNSEIFVYFHSKGIMPLLVTS